MLFFAKFHNHYSYISVRYTHHEDTKTFKDARLDCQKRCGYLLSTIIKPNSVIAKDVVAGNVVQDRWVGIQRINGSWFWSNGSIANQNQWKRETAPALSANEQMMLEYAQLLSILRKYEKKEEKEEEKEKETEEEKQKQKEKEEEKEEEKEKGKEEEEGNCATFDYTAKWIQVDSKSKRFRRRERLVETIYWQHTPCTEYRRYICEYKGEIV